MQVVRTRHWPIDCRTQPAVTILGLSYAVVRILWLLLLFIHLLDDLYEQLKATTGLDSEK